VIELINKLDFIVNKDLLKLDDNVNFDISYTVRNVLEKFSNLLSSSIELNLERLLLLLNESFKLLISEEMGYIFEEAFKTFLHELEYVICYNCNKYYQLYIDSNNLMYCGTCKLPNLQKDPQTSY
jgi:hypothetical protein